MDIYPAVFIATDGSEDAEVAVHIGGAVAAGLGVSVTVVTVWAGDSDVPGSQDYEWARSVGEAAETVLREIGVRDVRLEQPTGDPNEIVQALATENPDSMLAIGARGLSSATSRLTSSMSNQLSHHSAADLLLARGPVPNQWRSVGLCTDGSSTSRVAVRRGMAVADALGAASHVVTAAKDAEEGTRLMNSTLAEIDNERPGTTVERDVLLGVLPAKALIEGSSNYDLLALGNRGMSGRSRLLGSIANRVSHGAQCSLLLVNTSRE